jgi:hypothetical protein
MPIDTDIFLMAIRDLQPSQLYINQEKLGHLLMAVKFCKADDVPPIPVKIMEGRWVMTDGHTRAFAAHLLGLQEIPVYFDLDELDWEAYTICVAWCLDKGIHSIEDLQGSVVSFENYQRLWLDRCARMQNALEATRQSLS